MKYLKIFHNVLILSFFFNGFLPVWAQHKHNRMQNNKIEKKEKKEFKDLLEETLKRNQKLMQQMFEDDFFKSFHKRAEEMMRDFNHGLDDDFDQFFYDDSFKQFFDRSGLFQEMGERDYEWREGEAMKTLVLKISTGKDQPLDVQIKNGMIQVKGKVEKTRKTQLPSGQYVESKRVYQLNRQIAVPRDVVEESAKFEMVDQQLHIHFKKRGSKSSDKSHKGKDRVRPYLKPIPHQDKDKTI